MKKLYTIFNLNFLFLLHFHHLLPLKVGFVYLTAPGDPEMDICMKARVILEKKLNKIETTYVENVQKDQTPRVIENLQIRVIN